MYNKEFSDKYINIIKQNEGIYYKDYKNLLDKVAKSSAIYKGQPVPTLYQGLFYGEKDKENFKKISNFLMSISKKIVKEYLINPVYRDLFNFSKKLENLILHEPLCDIYVPMARYDIFYNGINDFKFCEFNTDGSSAMNEDNAIGNILLNSMAMKELSKNFFLKNVDLFSPWVEKTTQFYEKKFNKKPNIAIVDFLDIGSPNEFEEFKKLYISKGYNCEIFDIRNLKYKDKKLYVENYKIDLVYRRIVTAEFMKNYDVLKDFIKAYYDNAFMMIGSFRSQIMHTKLIFEILRNPMTKKILSDEENVFVEEHIPFTKKLEKKDINKLISFKDKYIIKPVDDYASHGVYAGKDFNENEWKNLLDKSFSNNYIFQEFYEMEKLDFVEFDEFGKLKVNKFSAVMGLFIYFEEFIAPYTRIGKKATIGGGKNYYTAAGILIENM